MNILKNQNSNYKDIKFNYKILFEVLIALLLLITTYIFISSSFKEEYYIWVLFSIWVGMFIYSLLDYANRIFLIMFLISFFNFLIGRSLLISIGLYNEYYYFTEYSNVQGQKIVLFSFIIFSISYYFMDKYFKRNNGSTLEKDYETDRYKKIKKISKVLYYILYVFLIYTVISKIIYVFQHGYPALYLNKTANVNVIIRKSGSLAPYFYFFFLSTMPSKQEVKKPMILWFAYLFSTLLIGARFSFVIGIITMFTYIVMRNFIGNNKEKWITKKHVIILIILGLLFLAFFSIYKDIRFENEIKSKDLSRLITDFFYEQGVNINNNKRIFQFKDSIPKDKIYSFNSLISFWDRNIGSRLMGAEVTSGNSLSRAYTENSLGDMLAVLVLGEEKYLSGFGVGSSYIAEVFHDFSWIGLIIINILFSFIMNMMQDAIHRGPVVFVITMNVFMALLKVPRANADMILLEIINPILWISVIIMSVTANNKVQYLMRPTIRYNYKSNLKNNFTKKGAHNNE